MAGKQRKKNGNAQAEMDIHIVNVCMRIKIRL